MYPDLDRKFEKTLNNYLKGTGPALRCYHLSLYYEVRFLSPSFLKTRITERDEL